MHSTAASAALLADDEPADDDGSQAEARRPRRNDPALAEWRRGEAIRLRMAGRSYEAIAREVGYANRGTAHKVVKAALEARTDEHIKMYRAVEVDRLRAQTEVVWPKAMAGDLKAHAILLRISDRRCRLLGLYARPGEDIGLFAPEPAAPKPPTTVVVGPEECARLAAERAAARL
jgi:hypothetical protein